mgnify:CR=1 FL=1
MSTLQSLAAVENRILSIASRYPPTTTKIVFAPSLSWRGTMFQRPQQLARALARKGALVFYIQPDRSWPAHFLELEERLFLVQAPPAAFQILPEAYIYTATWTIPQLAAFDSPRVIYDVLDHLTVFEGSLARLERNHQRYLGEASLVTVTSQTLYREVIQTRKDALFCPNGVDYQHFNQQDPGDPPADLAGILDGGRPLIGYHGALASWFDYQLLTALARRLPEMDFVLIGMDYDGSLAESALLEEPNLHYLGQVDYDQLPGYVGNFDVGLIPFQVNEITRATSPIKLYEYLAAGVPVVSATLPDVGGFEGVITASSIDAYQAGVLQALEYSQDQGRILRLQAQAREQQWEDRAGLILDRLDQIEESAVGEGRRKERKGRARPGPWWLRRVYHIWRLSGLRGVLAAVVNKTRYVIKSRGIFQIKIPRAYRTTYIPENFSLVTLYREGESPFPDHQPVEKLSPLDTADPIPVSLIATAYNEEDSVGEWIEAILAGSVLPAEIVVVDAGSTDATAARLEDCQARCPVPLRVLPESRVNIARGRNLAIQAARHPTIVVTDFGCRPHPDWLEKLTAPFRLDLETEVVGGWSRAVNQRGFSKEFPGWLTLADVDPAQFIPSSRSIAFTREAWEKAGGYPEWLTLTGEDTYFGWELKRFCPHWAFVPSAVVDWMGSNTWLGFLKKAFTWSAGNGELGYNNWLYLQAAIRPISLLLSTLLVGVILAQGGAGLIVGGVVLGAALVIFGLDGILPWQLPGEMGLLTAQVLGFIRGASRKQEVDRRRLVETKGIFLILTGVPIEDTGGGARCAQIALELLRQGYWVIYTNRFPSYESQKSGAHIAHPNLFKIPWAEFDWEDFLGTYGDLMEEKSFATLIEMPLPEFLPLLESVRERGPVLYELIDDWDSSLGEGWYAEMVEEEIIHLSQGLIGSAPKLVQRLENGDRPPVLYLPNAVNSRLFNPDFFYLNPEDLPQAKRTLLYIGALWGDWFDWALLEDVARGQAGAAISVIGDYRGQCLDRPPNLHFLGLKPQTELPAYLAQADLALIPWKNTPITQATSPLKVYEFLAMGVPVVAPDLEPLRGVPGVWLAKDRGEFLEIAHGLSRKDLPLEEVRAFIHENDWESRVRQLLAYAESIKE